LLEVTVADGHIVVNSHSKNTVEVTVTKTARAKTQEDAEALFEKVTIDYEQDGNTVRIETKKKQYKDWKSKGSLQVELEILVPAEFNGNLITSDGDVKIMGVNGDQKLTTSDGDIWLKGVEGSLELITSDGDVALEDIKGNISAITSDGNVLIKNLIGQVSATTSDGDVQLQLSDQPTGTCELFTTDGNISMSVPEGIKANFNVSVSDGEINFAFPYKNHLKHEDTQVLQAKTNGGGTVINISTSDGNVSVQPL